MKKGINHRAGVGVGAAAPRAGKNNFFSGNRAIFLAAAQKKFLTF